MAGLPKNKPEDVWKYVKIRSPNECWPYLGTIAHGGYGQIRIDNKYYKAHRIVYFLSRGGIQLNAPRNQYVKEFVLHHCDRRDCCNPDHLYLGDIWDNMRDKVSRGRQFRARGEIHVKSKLTNADAARVREALLFGAKRRDLENTYGVGDHVIEHIARRETYLG
jgi:hypothetical protein